MSIALQPRSLWRRKLADRIMMACAVIASLIGILALIWILWVVFSRGARAINWEFFTASSSPPGEPGGGLKNAFVGTFYITGLACLFGIPVGLMAGIYLSEFGANNRLGSIVRFGCNVLMGIPSIIIGLFIWVVLVVPMKRFSGWAGALALAIMILPVIARTTEDMLRMVPDTLRESAMALGATRLNITFAVLFRVARVGLLSGVLLAVARITGETAPLLFTALNSAYFPESLNGPTANLTVTIFNYAMSPYDNWQAMAWGASLIITISVLLLSIIGRITVREVKR